MEKIKIIYIVETLGAGVYRHIKDLYTNMIKDDKYEIYILYSENRIDTEKESFINKDDKHFIMVKNLKRKIGINDIKCIKEIRHIIKNIKPDIVHCHSSKAGLDGRIAAKIAKVNNIIYSPHAYYFLKFKKGSLKNWIYLTTEKFLSRRFTDYTVATSKGEEDAYNDNKIDKSNKCVLIKHGIYENNISEEMVLNEKQKIGIKDDEITVGAMCRMEEQKDPIGTLTIMKKIAKNIPNTQCILYGDGKLMDKVKKEYNDMETDLKEKIHLLGHTDNADCSIQLFDIYITASLYEGLPYTLLQVLSHKKPIIASNVEGNTDCVINKENGYIFESQNYDQAFSECKEMINNKEIEKMGKKSYQIFKEKFSIYKMIESYKELYGKRINK